MALMVSALLFKSKVVLVPTFTLALLLIAPAADNCNVVPLLLIETPEVFCKALVPIIKVPPLTAVAPERVLALVQDKN